LNLSTIWGLYGGLVSLSHDMLPPTLLPSFLIYKMVRSCVLSLSPTSLYMYHHVSGVPDISGCLQA